MKKPTLHATLALAIVFAIGLTGCSTTAGSYQLSSEFVYPNSNVTPLNNVQVSEKKFGILIPPSFSEARMDQLLNRAVSSVNDADLLIDYMVNTKITSLWIFHNTRVTIQGTAASMEVGKQDLSN